MTSFTDFSEDMTNCTGGSSLEDAGESECFNREKECCLAKDCGKPDTRPPFARTMPDQRRYGIVISSEKSSAEPVDTTLVLSHIFDTIENCAIPNIQFSQCVPTSVFDGNMLVICKDDVTGRWLIEAIKELSPPHSALSFIEFFKLIRCSIVLPVIKPKKSTCGIFSYFESQNENINTNMWAVVSREDIDPCKPSKIEPIQTVLGNEILDLYIDLESKEVIESQRSKIKYMMWKIKFHFDCKDKI